MGVALKQKTCKAGGCRNKFAPANSFHVACSPSCAVAITATSRANKDAARRKSDKLRLEAIQPIGHWLKKAQVAFNAYIRARDKGRPCISCGEVITGKTDAGHYLSVGARSELRFHPANCHAQCVRCNQHLSANLINYRIGLIDKVGSDMVKYLENFNGLQGLTIDDVRSIEAHYKELRKLG